MTATVRLAALLGCLALAGCASDGIDSGGPVTAQSAPILGPALRTREQVIDGTSESFGEIAATVVNAPFDALEFLFGPDPRTPSNGGARDPQAAYEERLLQRRSALGLPPSADARVAQRQASRRQAFLRGAR